VLHVHLGAAPRALLHDVGRVKWESTDVDGLRAFAAGTRLGAEDRERSESTVEESVDGRPALRALLALRLTLPQKSFGTLALSYRLDDLKRDERRTRLLTLGLVSSLFVILVVLLNVWLSRIVIAPLRRVLRAMERAGTGDLSVSLEVTSRDEFGLMAGTFNRMARELRSAREAVERYLATVVENVGTGVLFTNSRGVVTTVNRRAAELLRLSEGSEGRSTSEVLEAGDLPKLRELLEAPGGGRREVTLRFPGRRVTLAAAATPLRGEEGNPLGAVLVLDDLTAVLYSQKLRAWKEAVEKVIHEIKNPLTPIRLSAQQLLTAFEERSPKLPELLPRAVKNILAAVESLAQLLGEFGQFYRLPRPILRDRDLNALVEEAVSLYAGSFPPAVRLEKDLAPEVPRLQADADQLKRVLGNLLQNALEAMDGRGGVVRVSTRRVPGSSVVEIAVADEGRGIGPEDMENLFEPYFTTKPRGTGLGLLISRQIVEEHGGELTLESAPGRGTTARVFLPVGKKGY
jgi:two-component system nitrogen regulation sensor histidine kinase NtrY